MLDTPHLNDVVDRVRAFVDGFESARSDADAVSSPMSESTRARLLSGPPERGADLESILAALAEAVDTGFDTAGPGFLSYIPTGALPSAALGAYVGAATNRYTGAPHASPGSVAIEQSVIQWMADLFGLPEGAGGVLLSGGSIANLTATVAARSQFGPDFSDGVVYTSAVAHHSVAKAAHIAGIRPDRVRLVATDDRRRMDLRSLDALVEADLASGLRPMLVVATAGTTDTGAVDPLHGCADRAGPHGAWFHIDAAYGGFFQLTERGRTHLDGIERADSITVDAHKSLFLPFGVGGLLVREPRLLVEAHEGKGSYMQDIEDVALPQFYAMGPELTRPNRGFQVWLPLQVHGVAAFAAELDRMLDLAAWTADALSSVKGVDVITSGPLSVVTFAVAAGDAATRAAFDHLNGSGHVHVSSTTMDGQFVIRVAYLSHRTTKPIAERVVALVREALGDREGAHGPS